MADNTELNPGVGGDIFAADDIAGVKYQRIKLVFGADGVNSGDVATGNPFPVSVIAALPAGANAIGAVTQSGGPWTQNLTQIGGGALALGQAAMAASIPVVIASNQSTINVQLQTGANVIGSLVANQSVNNTQINGSAIVTVATGVQKVGISDGAGNSFLSAANALNSAGTGIQAVQLAGQFDDVSPTVITENQFGNLRMSNNRNLYATLRDAAGNERGLNISAQNAASITGDVAAAATDAGNPVKIGGQARTTNPAAVADGQRVNAMFDKVGRQVVVVGQVRELRAVQRTQIVNSTAETTILASGGASVFHDVYFLLVSNASGQQVDVTIRDATSGTVRFTISLAAYGGAVIQPPRAHPQATANNNWTAQLSVGTVTVNITVMADKNL